MIRRFLVRIPAPRGGTELHVEVSLGRILNPKVAPDVQLVPCVAASKPRKKKRQHPATLTDKWKENGTE